jgi:hypothetical protein
MGWESGGDWLQKGGGGVERVYDTASLWCVVDCV